MQLVEVYDEMVELGLCESRTEFSEDWLGRSGGYLNYLLSSGARPCLTSIKLLLHRLKAVCPDHNATRFFAERTRVRILIRSVAVMLGGEVEIQTKPKWVWAIAI